jgi:aldose 1-epimerase
LQFLSEDLPTSRLTDRLTIGSGRSTASIDTRAGGRVAQLTVDGQPLLVEPDATRAATVLWGMFPMAPWAGRVRHGRFTFEGRDHRLERNHLDAPGASSAHGGLPDDEARRHAIHGTVFTRPWDVDEVTSSGVSMHCSLDADANWPFAGGTARQRVEISDDGLDCTLSVEATRSRFPAVIGWHPWFVKHSRLRFHPTAMYERDPLGIPTGTLVEPTAGPWDDCFVASGPAILEYDRHVAPVVTVSSDCDHWVIYDEPENSICVEPQSGPPNGLELGFELVTPQRPLTRTMRVSW